MRVGAPAHGDRGQVTTAGGGDPGRDGAGGGDRGSDGAKTSISTCASLSSLCPPSAPLPLPCPASRAFPFPPLPPFLLQFLVEICRLRAAGTVF